MLEPYPEALRHAADVVQQERERRGATIDQMYRRGGCRPEVWANLERAHPLSSQSDYLAVDRALGFTAGTVWGLVCGRRLPTTSDHRSRS